MKIRVQKKVLSRTKDRQFSLFCTLQSDGRA